MKTKLLILLISLSSISFAQKKTDLLTQIEKQQLVDEHNKWRTEVGNDSLIWSEDLSKVAQKWADNLAKTCNMYHSSTDYGENIYWTMTTATPVDVVTLWADEKQYYSGQKISESNYMKFGHYTQLVWYDTTEIGCAKATCKGGGEIWVCNYNPPGNYIDEKAYGND
jgi:pathogenesis-related protein 1